MSSEAVSGHESWAAFLERAVRQIRRLQQGHLNAHDFSVRGQGGTLTAGLPRQCDPNTLCWWPCGIEDRFRIAPVSSRIGRKLDLKPDWFAALRTIAIRCDQRRECLIGVPGTAAFEFVQRAGGLFGAPFLTIHPAPTVVCNEADLARWLEPRLEPASQHSGPHETHAHVGRLLLSDSVEKAAEEPTGDTQLIAAAERIVALECRAGGTINGLLTRTLLQAHSPPVLVAQHDTTALNQIESLIQKGAVPWLLTGDAAESGAVETPLDVPPWRDGPLDCPEDWLCHWTRRTDGPWPRQPRLDYIDELILGSDSADRTAVATLLRILSSEQILGSVSTSGEVETVSFTEVPLSEFRQQRVYRRHKRRFDFEPWGLAIRRSVLQQLGARPVTYTNDNHQAKDGRFTQSRFDATGRIDWSLEREWRIAAPLTLSSLQPNDICVFVNSAGDRNTVSTRFPVNIVITPDGAI